MTTATKTTSVFFPPQLEHRKNNSKLLVGNLAAEAAMMTTVTIIVFNLTAKNKVNLLSLTLLAYDATNMIATIMKLPGMRMSPNADPATTIQTGRKKIMLTERIVVMVTMGVEEMTYFVLTDVQAKFTFFYGRPHEWKGG